MCWAIISIAPATPSRIWVTSPAKATARFRPSDRVRSIAACLAAMIEAPAITHIAAMIRIPTAMISPVIVRARRVVAQTLLLAFHDCAVLPQEGAHVVPQNGPQRGQPGCGPIDAMVDLGDMRVDRRDCGQIGDAMTAGADLLDAHARQPEDDL